MTRLRNLHGTEDVTLVESAKPDQVEDEADSAAVGSEAASGSDGCGDRYTFKTAVTFASPATAATAKGKRSDRVPATLGGGS